MNILTSLLVAHGVRRAVVCPGSRNAAIVHNLNESPDIECFPVTDERSAGFFAIGIAQATVRLSAQIVQARRVAEVSDRRVGQSTAADGRQR